MKIWTIGHSTRTLGQFVAALESQRIGMVVDIRALPGSRRYPQFDLNQLASSLRALGIGYEHLRELGGRRKLQVGSRNLAWRHPAFRAYADYMETPAFAKAAERLMKIAEAQRTAILCAELLWWRCHRSLISDFLKAKGWSVIHVFDANKVQEHPFTAAARFQNGELSYRRGKPARDAGKRGKGRVVEGRAV